MLRIRLLRRNELHQLHFLELMLPDQPAYILSMRPASARKQGV